MIGQHLKTLILILTLWLFLACSKEDKKTEPAELIETSTVVTVDSVPLDSLSAEEIEQISEQTKDELETILNDLGV